MRQVNKLADLGKLLSTNASASDRTEAESAQMQPEGNCTGQIRLARAIEVKCWHVIGKVAKGQKRPEIIAVLLRAKECGAIDANDVAGHLLFESKSRRVVAQRLLQIAQNYGLLESEGPRFVLTEAGQAALKSEQIFVPEHGSWTVWASNDPLLTTPILRIDPWEDPSAYEEVRGKERDKARERNFEKLPEWVRGAKGVAGVPLTGGAPLRIDELEPKGEAADPKSTLRAFWDVTVARLRIGGQLGDTPVDTAIEAPVIGADAVWMQLLKDEGLWAAWDAAVRALRVGFDETTPGERERLIRAVAFARPVIEGLGVFDRTTVDGIAMRARSEQDAASWAEWRLRARIRNYATAELFADWTAEATAPFPEFELTMPARNALATLAWRDRKGRPETYTWHLVAAADWGL